MAKKENEMFMSLNKNIIIKEIKLMYDRVNENKACFLSIPDP